MDNNKQPSVSKPEPVDVSLPAEKGGSKMIMWFVTGLVIIGLVVGGIYWYLGKQQTATAPISQPTVQPTSAPTSLDQDLNSIDVQASDSGFTSVDQDLKTL